MVCALLDRKHVDLFGVHGAFVFGAHDQCDDYVPLAFCDSYPEILQLFSYRVSSGWRSHNLLIFLAPAVSLFQELPCVQCLATPWKSWP